MKQAYLLRCRYLGGFAEEFPLTDSWCRDIKVPAKITLEEMNSIILTVLDWEDDGHLFAFKVGERVYAWLDSDSFVIDEKMFKGAIYSAAIFLSELCLQEGDTFTYIFDFGDEHTLLFEVLQVAQLLDTVALPLLVSKQGGSPPPQYPASTESRALRKIWRSLNKSAGNCKTTTARKNSQICSVGSIPFFKSPSQDRWRVRFVSGTDKRVLDEWRKSKDKRQWDKAVAILENWNLSPEEIAEKIERPLPTIKKWIQTFNCYGLEGLSRPRKKRVDIARQKKTEERSKRLLEILHQPPSSFGINRSNWNLKSIVDIYAKEQGESIAQSTASRLIRKTGYRFKKAKMVLTSQDPDYREKVELLLKTLQDLTEDEMFYFIDELGPLQVKKYGGRAYSPKGDSRTFPQNPTTKGSITLSGALSATTNQITWSYGVAKDTQAMIDLVEILFNQQFEKARLFVTWDAASWHNSNALIAWLDEFNTATRQAGSGPIIELVPLPTCSQFLDVIEAVFSGMKRAVIHNSDYQSKDEMKTAISKHFLDRNAYFKENPRRAGKKIWEIDFFNDSKNLRSGDYREW